MKNIKKDSFIWIVVALGLFLLLGLFVFGGMGYGMMGMMYGNYGFGMMFFGWIFGALVIIALVLLIIWLFNHIQKR